jgi:hypothetical protein
MGAAFCSNSNKVVSSGAVKLAAVGKKSVKVEDPGDSEFTYLVSDRHVDRLWRAVASN